MGILIVASILMFFDYDLTDIGLVGLSIFTFMLLFSFSPIGDTKVETTIGKNTRVGNEFIISSKFPTQIATHVEFDGQEEVVVKRITDKNAWGGDMIVTYKISTK
jgi:hypothetical protein